MAQKFANNAKTRLVGNIGVGDTSFTVTTGDGDLFPTITPNQDHFLVTFENSSGEKEIARVIGRSGDTFTIGIIANGVATEDVLGRGEDGTIARAFSSGDLVELRLTAGYIDALSRGSIVFVIDGGGAAISPGLKGFIEAPFPGTIESVRLFADVVGSIVVDIYKDTFANYDPTIDQSGDSITDITPPTISSSFKSEDSTLTSWTKSFSEGDIFYFNVDSCSTIKKCTVSMTVNRAYDPTS